MKKLLLSGLLALVACLGAKATEIWTGSCTIGNWSGSSVTVEKSAFESAAAGNVIRITFSGYTTSYTEDEETKSVTDWSYALQQKDNGWVNLTDFTGGNLKQGQKCASYVLTEDDVTTLKAQGLAVNGQYITISKVELLTTTSESLSTTSTECSDSWANLDLTWSNKGNLANAMKYDCVRVTYTVNAKSAQMKIQTVVGEWTDRAYKWDDTYEENGTNTGKTHFFTISDATILEQVQQAGIAISAANVTITAVDLIKPSDRYDAVPATIGEDGIATFSSSKHLSFAEAGITPYYASEINDDNSSVTLTPVDNKTTWGYQGYVLRGAAGSYDIPVIEESEAAYPSDNLLKATSDYAADLNVVAGKNRYIFAKNGSNIGFYRLGSAYTLAAHRAYLEIDDTSAAARVSLLFSDDETTAVQTIEAIERPQSDKIYNISGQQVVKPTRGLYIINGKK